MPAAAGLALPSVPCQNSCNKAPSNPSQGLHACAIPRASVWPVRGLRKMACSWFSGGSGARSSVVERRPVCSNLVSLAARRGRNQAALQGLVGEDALHPFWPSCGAIGQRHRGNDLFERSAGKPLAQMCASFRVESRRFAGKQIAQTWHTLILPTGLTQAPSEPQGRRPKLAPPAPE